MNGFGIVKQIYGNLQDDASRNIFIRRLVYALTGNKKEIDKIVLDEMKRYGQDDIVNRLIIWLKDREGAVNIFGAGFAGRQIVHALQINGIAVGKIYDNNPKLWGKDVFGCQIHKPDKPDSEEAIVLGVDYHREDILSQLINMGVRRSDIFIPDCLWWLGKYKQYFDEEIITPGTHEIFVDGGSLDGHDSVNFINWCNGKYDAIYAFEPDMCNWNRVYATAGKYRNFNVYTAGLWSGDGELSFSSGIGANCFISEHGEEIVKVSSVDNILTDTPVTYIKMDIEGSELEAIKGAEKTIRKYKPRLAICVYHKPEDIIELPKKILELNPDYKFYLRHYSYLATETVLYAI